jgi:arylsulfatase A-like enzyme
MNIVFILIDTLRATRLGCYGYERPTSPAMDRLAAQGARFVTCLAPGVPTTPAHTTLYTGQHPLTHNIVSHGGRVDLDRSTPVLPEVLQRGGYTTAAVDNLYDIKPWLARGYEFYVNPSHRHRMRLMVSCDEINARAIPWLEQHGGERFFLFLHYWEPHTPYLPPQKYRTFYPDGRNPFDPNVHTFEPIKRQPFWQMFGDTWFKKLGPITDAEYVASLYDGEIRHADDAVGQVMETLERLGLAEETLFVVTADHGESLGSHDIYFDHHGLYEDVIRVPLIVRYPAAIAAGLEPDAVIEQQDVAPTLLEAAGVEAPHSMEGRSFWPLLTSRGDVPGSAEVVCLESTWQSKYALRTPTRKLILSREPDRHGMPRRELYDLATDPEEICNLADALPEEADIMEARLEALIAERLARAGRTEDPLRAQGITLGSRWDSLPGK